MKEDDIYIGIIELLKSNNDGLNLDEKEINRIATLVDVLVKSGPEIRKYFNIRVDIIAQEIVDILKEKNEILAQKLPKKGNILN